MSAELKHCTQCGGPVAHRMVDDRPRAVCTGCGHILYQNPLPVAASVVLNEHRHVLLVRRKQDPQKGMWCLPIGFAELGETIAEAAQRELREETGVEGRILQLLDADSFDSDFYGDLLIVTFQQEKIGGSERPGDDAAEVAYFPLDAMPPLAFSSNDKAIESCVALHQDEWAIQDSYEGLQEDNGQSLLSDALVTMIEAHAREVTGLWLAEVRTHPTTPTYHTFDNKALRSRGVTAISQFGRWLKQGNVDNEVRTFYRELGRERRQQGFAAHEVASSLTLLRKHVWVFAHNLSVWSRPIDAYRVLELNRRVALFFDKAVYHALRGFDDLTD